MTMICDDAVVVAMISYNLVPAAGIIHVAGSRKVTCDYIESIPAANDDVEIGARTDEHVVSRCSEQIKG